MNEIIVARTYDARIRDQFAAIAGLRWRLFVNALRSTRGKLELLSQIAIAFAFAVGGLGGAFGMAIAASIMISAGRPELLALLLWSVFFFWQLFPIMTTAFGGTADASGLLRFPLNYRSYFLVRIAFGAFDPATAVGILWSMGILFGVSFAKPLLLPWTLLVLASFAAFNLLFMQMIFAWIERWLAQRRTREIMGVLFILFMLSFQLIGPLARHLGRRTSRPDVQRYVDVVVPVQRLLPPGLAGDAIAQAVYPRIITSVSSFALLCASILVVGYTLHLRLLAQYRGENLSEVAASVRPHDRSLRLGWKIPGFSSSLTTVFEKEVRYLLRSGPVLLTLIMPMFALLVIRFGAMNSLQHSSTFFSHGTGLAFPIAAAYTLVILTNLICNIFGADAAGIQFFFAAPVRFREIVLAKNLTHACILMAEILVAWIAVSVLYGPPQFSITIAALMGLLFAAPLNFSVGNLLSITAPKRVDYSSFRNTKPSPTSALISLLVQLFMIGVGVLVFWIASFYGSYWIAAAIFLALSGISLVAYRMILNRMDGLARERQETLLAELCRA
jgi:ABC-2 type transport system permease protein